MKRRILIVLLIFICSSVLSASVGIRIYPYSGAYGVPLNSTQHTYDSTNTEQIFKWEGSSDDNLKFNGTTNRYSNAEMIAFIGFGDVSLEEIRNKPLEVVITCNGGFYFVSQSNPAFKRPFQLVFVPASNSLSGDNGRGTPRIFSDSDEMRITIDNPREDLGISSFSTGELHGDLVLILPGTVDTNSDVLTVDTNRGTEHYPLIEADDYSALVTITVSHGTDYETITIPFSGFYDRTYDPSEKRDDSCNLYVEAYGAAGSLDINRDKGRYIPVGKIDFIMDAGIYPDGATYNPSRKNQPLIFASSSRNPEENAGKFRLVHEKVTYDTPLTTRNCVEYSVRIRDVGTTGTSTGLLSSEFTGEENIKTGDSSTWIHPSMEVVSYDTTKEPFNGRIYYNYTGEIDVEISHDASAVMDQGAYYDSIYLHVVTGE